MGGEGGGQGKAGEKTLWTVFIYPLHTQARTHKHTRALDLLSPIMRTESSYAKAETGELPLLYFPRHADTLGVME